MRTIAMSEIRLDGQDAKGRYAVATINGEQVGVSMEGEDEALRSLDGLHPGDLVEVGTERMRVVSGKATSLRERETAEEIAKAMIREVAAVVGDDGTGDLGIIVRQALADDPAATASEIAEIVVEARETATAERERA